MNAGKFVSQDFFDRPTTRVARDLVGATLLVDAGTDQEVVATIVEVEAYLGMGDEASHAYRGPTPRSSIMFGAPGRLYVYFTYGMHYCANIVTDHDGKAGAVLLRSALVESGETTVRARRDAPNIPVAHLLRGPGNMCRGLGVDGRDNGSDVGMGRVGVLARTHRVPIVNGARVGIRRARDDRLRFAWAGHPAISLPRL